VVDSGANGQARPPLLLLDMTEALRPSELFALRWRSFDDHNTLSITETVYRRQIRPFGKTPGSLSKVHLPDGLAERTPAMEVGVQGPSPEASSFQTPTAGSWTPQLPVPGSQAACGEAGDRKTELPDPAPDHGYPGAEDGVSQGYSGAPAARPADTTANEYMQELPESVQEMVGSMYAMLKKGGGSKKGVLIVCYQMLPTCSQRTGCKLLIYGGRCRIRTCDFHRVKVALYR
jgi:hypothetical protein